MIILGIHDGHDSSVALMQNGKIIYASQEERFSRLKADYGLPIGAIKDCLNFTKIKNFEIDLVALGSHHLNPVLSHLKRNANFSVSDWVDEQEKYWKQTLIKNKKISYYNLFKDKKFKKDKIYNYKGLLNTYMSRKDMDLFQKRRIEKITNILSINKSKINLIYHEDCHKYYSYFFSSKRVDGIAITCEGVGDYSSASVSDIKKNNFKIKSHNKENRLGHTYQYITLLLGMKPLQHEYKVMGLAPYASEYEINKCFKVFDDIQKVKKLDVVYKIKPKDFYFHFVEKLKKSRFDGIAGALQKFVEKILNQWFLSCKKNLKLKNFYFSGGVAQNIKAGMSLNENKNIGNIVIPPAAGDTSISLGACYKAAYDHCIKNKISTNNHIKPLDNLYLGSQIQEKEIKSFIEKNKIKNKYKITKNYKLSLIAKYLFNGKIIARCSGRMEFGLRALGNRSIICDPRFYSNIEKINKKIKKRDFWMPFTPTILKEDCNKYLSNKKKIDSKYMAMAFNTTDLGKQKLKAAIHPADFTTRPQMLSYKDNPQYYKLIKEFKKLSGVGSLLNTSLNLHGLPIARNTADAFYVFKNSDLDCLIIENYLFVKKNEE